MWSLYANGTDIVPIHGTTSGWNYYSSSLVVGPPNYVWAVGSGGEEQNGTYDMMGNVWEIMQSGNVGRGGFFLNYPFVLGSENRDTESFSSHDPVNYAGIRIVKIIPDWTVPVVSNGVASAVTDASANLNGTVIDIGGETPSVIIYWGDNDGGTVAGGWDNSISMSIQNGPFFATISGLIPNKMYYYRCYAANLMGGDWADSASIFTTIIPPMSIVLIDFFDKTNLLVKWQATNGWNYSLQESTDLLATTWGNVSDATNLPGINGIMCVTNSSFKYPRQFYRIISNRP